MSADGGADDAKTREPLALILEGGGQDLHSAPALAFGLTALALDKNTQDITVGSGCASACRLSKRSLGARGVERHLLVWLAGLQGADTE
jgi:hypothetical protein